MHVRTERADPNPTCTGSPAPSTRIPPFHLHSTWQLPCCLLWLCTAPFSLPQRGADGPRTRRLQSEDARAVHMDVCCTHPPHSTTHLGHWVMPVAPCHSLCMSVCFGTWTHPLRGSQPVLLCSVGPVSSAPPLSQGAPAPRRCLSACACGPAHPRHSSIASARHAVALQGAAHKQSAASRAQHGSAPAQAARHLYAKESAARSGCPMWPHKVTTHKHCFWRILR